MSFSNPIYDQCFEAVVFSPRLFKVYSSKIQWDIEVELGHRFVNILTI